MLKDFESNILKKELFNKTDKLLLAISGGIDSVVLAYLLKNSGFEFSLAHCNFQLRGKDSKADEKFCKDLAKKLGVKIHTSAFDTEAYCKEHKVNVQLAARSLRYEWFTALLRKHKFHYLLTAHQANDVMETIFINLLRGTGINGLKGIPEKRNKLVRPLLNFTREQIEEYAMQKKIRYRLDKSNLEDKYERNFIRLNIIPLLKKINPKLEDTFIRNTANFAQEAQIVTDYLESRSTEMITQAPGLIFINKKKLKHEVHAQSVLHHLIKGYGFNETQQKNILKNIDTNAVTGKNFVSPSHQLTIDRNDVIIKPVSEKDNSEKKIGSLNELKKVSRFQVKKLKGFHLPGKNELLIEQSKLIFPLTLRSKQNGDKFRPFGMKGFKLVSDYLKDEKLNAFEKENCKLLVNGNGDIIWVIGYRSDDRYKVSAKNTDLLNLILIE